MGRPRVMGGPSLEERQKGGNMDEAERRSVSGADRIAATEGLRMNYEQPEENSYLEKHGAYYDPSIGIFFTARTSCCTNLTPMTEIPKRIAGYVANAEKYGNELVSIGGHDQYSFPYYSNYIPDHNDRIELICRLLHENGYRSVFFNEGLPGNKSREE